MACSVAEVQEFADQILALLGSRIRNGQLVVHFADGVVQRCEVHTVHRAKSQPLRKNVLDNATRESAP